MFKFGTKNFSRIFKDKAVYDEYVKQREFVPFGTSAMSSPGEPKIISNGSPMSFPPNLFTIC